MMCQYLRLTLLRLAREEEGTSERTGTTFEDDSIGSK
jgi:hypothetical protein